MNSTKHVCEGIVFQETAKIVLVNLILRYVGVHAYLSNDTVMMNLTLIRPYKNGITANKTTSVNIKHVVVSDANGYCIRLEQARDTTVSLGKLNNCSMSGIEVIAGRDTSLDSITFTYMFKTALSFQSQE